LWVPVRADGVELLQRPGSSAGLALDVPGAARGETCWTEAST
jgi:hypothetical protein